MEVVTTLSALAIIQRDDELLHAAIEEIEKLPLDLRVTLDPAGDVVHLLVVHHLLRVRPRSLPYDNNTDTELLITGRHRRSPKSPNQSLARLT